MDLKKLTVTPAEENSRKLNAAFVRALAQGQGQDAAPDAYSFSFMADANLPDQPFDGVKINKIADTIYTGRANRAGVEAMMNDERVIAMQLGRTNFTPAPQP